MKESTGFVISGFASASRGREQQISADKNICHQKVSSIASDDKGMKLFVYNERGLYCFEVVKSKFAWQSPLQHLCHSWDAVELSSW